MVQKKSDPLLTVAQYILWPIVTLSYISAYIGLILSCILCFTSFLSILCLKLKFRLRTKESTDRVIAFFHPYCDAGGGGERVLWCGIRAIQRRFPAEKIVIYTGDVNSAPDQIISKANRNFNIEINVENLEFIYG